MASSAGSRNISIIVEKVTDEKSSGQIWQFSVLYDFWRFSTLHAQVTKVESRQVLDQSFVNNLHSICWLALLCSINVAILHIYCVSSFVEHRGHGMSESRYVSCLSKDWRSNVKVTIWSAQGTKMQYFL